MPAMEHKLFEPRKALSVNGLYSVHYFEYSNTYSFDGESHDFWEFLYVDKGVVKVTADGTELTLKKGQIIFHAPGEFHTVHADGVIAPNLVVSGFSAKGDAMSYFVGKVLSVSDAEKALMAKIVQEADNAFSTRLDDPTTTSLERKDNALFGAEQLITQFIEQLLINFLRKNNENCEDKQVSYIRKNSQDEFIKKITEYLEANLYRQLTLADICKDNLVGRSYLQKIFREKTGGGAMEYFGRLKISASKTMMREGTSNFTEIASLLGYNSIHYFSRHFKKVTGMTPSEYASSIKAFTGGATKSSQKKDKP